jgi:hypothetical protein
VVAAALLLAALLAAVPNLGLVPVEEREPAGPVGQAPADGGLGATGVGQRQTPAGGADQPQPARDLGDDDGDDGGGGSGGGGSGEGGGGGSSGPD